MCDELFTLNRYGVDNLEKLSSGKTRQMFIILSMGEIQRQAGPAWGALSGVGLAALSAVAPVLVHDEAVPLGSNMAVGRQPPKVWAHGVWGTGAQHPPCLRGLFPSPFPYACYSGPGGLGGPS